MTWVTVCLGPDPADAWIRSQVRYPYLRKPVRAGAGLPAPSLALTNPA